MKYANVSVRIKAAVIDTIFIVLFICIYSFGLGLFDEVHNLLRVGGFIFIFFLYDPLFTSFTGGTIGHHAMGIKVRKSTTETENIPFVLALIRFLIKAVLGWISLIIVSSDVKHQALHDKVVNSIVIHS